ncbi:MAG: hypothetical protein ABIF40_00535 [archaeon]
MVKNELKNGFNAVAPYLTQLQKGVNALAPYLLTTVAVAAGLNQGIDSLENVVYLHDSIQKGLFWGGLFSFGNFVLRPVHQQGLNNYLKSLGNYVSQTVSDKDAFNYEDLSDLKDHRQDWQKSPLKRNIKSAVVGVGLAGLLLTPGMKDVSLSAYERAQNDFDDWTNTPANYGTSKTSGTSVLYSDREYDLSVDEIENVLSRQDSPMKGQGKHILDCAKKYDVRPEVFLAFAQMDSSMGTAGVGARNYNPTNIRPSSNSKNPWACEDVTDSRNGKFCNYGLWERGIEAWFQLIKGMHLEKDRTTVEEILPSFAPSSENDTKGYISFVVDYMDGLNGS